MTITLSHLWAIQTLRTMDMTQPLSAIQLLRVTSILCPDLKQEEVWSEMAYTDLLERLREAVEQVVALINAEHQQVNEQWSMWPSREIDAA